MGCVQEFTDGRCQVVPASADSASETSGRKQDATTRDSQRVGAVSSDMPAYFGVYLLQQMTLAAMFTWWFAPLVSKGVRSEILPPLPFCQASPPRKRQ